MAEERGDIQSSDLKVIIGDDNSRKEDLRDEIIITCALSPSSDVSHEPESKSRRAERYCEICKTGNARRCSNCRQVSYCGKEHQLQHWKTHKLNCVPVKVVDVASLNQRGQQFQGRDSNHALVATRNIKAGEVFFRENAIVTSPGPWDPEGIEVAKGRPICVSCCEIIRGGCEYDDDDDEDCTTRCSHCHWPVCNRFCETNSRHSEYECKVLSANRVSTMVLNQMPDYECILVLRALQLKEKDPENWKRLMNLEPMAAWMDNELSSNYLNSAVKFIRELCGLRQYSDGLIRQVASICFLHSMYNDDHPGDNGYIYKIATYVGDVSSKVAHSCVANSEWAVISLEEDEIQFRALIPIKHGELITTVYDYKTICHQGTRFRQRFLYDHYFFSCSCRRCKDPTELQTYCSAIKCSSVECNGNLLPLDPCELNSVWACDSGTCPEVRNRCWVEHTIDAVQSKLDAFPYMDPMRVTMRNNDAKRLIKGLRRFVEQSRRTILHPNHYLLLAAEWKIIENSYHIIMSVKRYSSDVVNLVTTIGKKHLDLYNILSPGVSRRRGFIFYYSQAGLLETLRHETLSLGKAKRKNLAVDDPEKLAKLKRTYFELIEMRSESTKIFSFKGIVNNSVEEELVNFSALDQPFMLCLKFLERISATDEEND